WPGASLNRCTIPTSNSWNHENCMSEPLAPTSAVELARRIGRSGDRFRDPAGARVVIAILTCERNRMRVEGVRASWLKHVPDSYRVLFVHGRPGQASSIE